MNRVAKIALALLVGFVVAFGTGWFYGSRRVTAARAEETSVAYTLGTARGELLEGRLELYNNNFGNAARHFDEAKRRLGTAIEFLDKDKAGDQATALRDAVKSIDAAIQRAGRLEPAAHESAAAAQKTIDTIVQQRAAAAR